MSAITFENKDRNVVPRWRDSRVRETRELESLGTAPARIINEEELNKRIEEWTEGKSVPTAADLVLTAVVFDRREVARTAADYLLSAEQELPIPLKQVAWSIRTERPQMEQSEPASALNIRQLRQRLQLYPQNALAWVDLAREYVNAGDLRRGMRAMQVALSSAPDARFILRCAARLYLHANEPDRAHHILLRAKATPWDPWLIAAELAVAPAAGVRAEFAFEGRQLLSAGRFAPIHVTELASALATLELHNGNRKRSRKIFERALECPTENTIAQVEWAAKQVGGIPYDQTTIEAVPRRYEALSFQYTQQGKWKKALEESRKWLCDQPFSSRPAAHASFLATSMIEDFGLAEEVARAGLRANPTDFTLLNNRAVALAKLGRTEEAYKSISHINRAGLTQTEQVVICATVGLLGFRSGRFDEGRRLYQEAISKAMALGLSELGDRALIYLAIEEIDHKTAEATTVLKKVVSVSERSSDTINSSLLERVAEHASTHLADGASSGL